MRLVPLYLQKSENHIPGWPSGAESKIRLIQADLVVPPRGYFIYG